MVHIRYLTYPVVRKKMLTFHLHYYNITFNNNGSSYNDVTNMLISAPVTYFNVNCINFLCHTIKSMYVS